MYVPTFDTSTLKTEKDFSERMIRIRSEMRQFRAKSNPIVWTKEMWEHWYQMQAEAVWLEDSLARIKQLRHESERKRKPATRYERMKRKEEDEEE